VSRAAADHGRRGAALLLLLAVLTAPSGVRAVSRPLYGGTLALARPAGALALDPAEARDPWQLALVHALHAGLYRHDVRGVPQPHLVEGPPEVLPDGSLRFRLRRPLTFHDGRPVAAADVRGSLLRRSGPLAWLSGLVRVHVVDGRTFDVVPRGLPFDELVALLALPQAAILPRGGDGRVGVGPFRLARGALPGAGTDGPLVLVAWDEAPGGRPFLDGLRFVPAAPGPDEAEAFHYGQLDLSLTDAPRLSDRPRLDGPVAETLVATFSATWAAGSAQDERRGLLARLAPGRGELVRHCDLPAAPARRWGPSGGPPAVPAQGRPGDWRGEPMIVAWRADDPALGDLAAALRDLLASEGLAQAVAAPARELPPLCRGRACVRHDLHLTTVPWPGTGGVGALAWAAAWLGLEDALPTDRLARAAADPAAAWQQFADGARAIPLLHVRRVLRHAPGLVGLRFAPWGGLVLEDVWQRAAAADAGRRGGAAPAGRIAEARR
jgi:MarR-like DNA-binding transcriptional regulator SgrR of sgrS sRNA